MNKSIEFDPTTQIPEALLKNSNRVYAGCFPSRNGQGSLNDDLLKRTTYKHLRSQGIKDQSVIVPCNSTEERLEAMLRLLQSNSKAKPGYDQKPWVIVADNDSPPLEESFAKLIKDKPEIAKSLRKTITIIEPRANFRDKRESSIIKVGDIEIVSIINLQPPPASLRPGYYY